MLRFLTKTEVRRYNFICHNRCLYSGLFKKKGLLDFNLPKKLVEKRDELCRTYRINPKEIIISNTIKD